MDMQTSANTINMKRFAILMIGFLIAVSAIGQTVVLSNYKAFGGTTSDTLIQSTTKSYTLDLGYIGKWKGNVIDYTIQVSSDYVSDSVGYTVKVYESLNGTTFAATALDSATVLKSVANCDYQKKFTARTPRYVKVSVTSDSNTQVSVLSGAINVTKHE